MTTPNVMKEQDALQQHPAIVLNKQGSAHLIGGERAKKPKFIQE